MSNKKDKEFQNMTSVTDDIKDINKLNNVKMTNDSKDTKKYVILSHELKTPLAIINNHAQLIKRFCELDKIDVAKFTKYSENIISNCNIINKIVNNLIDISFFDSKDIKLNYELVDINKLCNTLIEFSNQYFIDTDTDNNQKLNINFKCEPAQNTAILFCDPFKIERIILNLISNSIKYNNKDIKNVTISISETKKEIIISVKDNGNGIAKKYYKSIFEPFVQIHDQNGPLNSGCGIGLSIVKFFTELHNGTIELITEVDNGSEFKIKLPKSSSCTKNSNCILNEKQEYHFNENLIAIEFAGVFQRNMSMHLY